ncbi:hypothetical protein NXS19_002337 [Fusarium pseudograminearum]|nr:hypothetical protein NXS19_002337 [Fusarium pseudograminearum]
MAAITPILTPALLAAIRKQPNLPRNTWYFITATTLSALNRPDELPGVLKSAIEKGSGTSGDTVSTHDEQLRISRRMREALLKASAVGGMPKTINALLSLKSATPDELLDEAGTGTDLASPRHKDIYDTQPAQVLQRGQSFFENIYGKISRRIMGQLERSRRTRLGSTGKVDIWIRAQ